MGNRKITFCKKIHNHMKASPQVFLNLYLTVFWGLVNVKNLKLYVEFINIKTLNYNTEKTKNDKVEV